SQRVSVGEARSAVRFATAAAPKRRPGANTDEIARQEAAAQQGISDYVASTDPGLKQQMLSNAVQSFRQLRTSQPGDQELLAKELFVQARLAIAEGRPAEAIAPLERAIALDPRTACPYNAMGVAQERTGDKRRAQEYYEKAAQIARTWALPHWQLGMLL